MNEPAAKPRHSKHPAVWLAAVFVLGIVTTELPLLRSCFEPIENNSSWRLLGTIIIVFLILSGVILRRSRPGAALLLIGTFLLGSFLLIHEKYSVDDNRIRTIYDQGRIGQAEPVTVEGTIDRGPEPAPNGVFISLRSTSIEHKREHFKATGTVRLFMPIGSDAAAADLESLGLRHGTAVRLSCRLTREDQFLNPGVRRRTEILDQQGIDATGSIKSPLLIVVIAETSDWSPLTVFYDLRRTTIDRINELFSPQTGGIMIAAMLGDKYFLDRETAEVFRQGGTFHILVISGLHMTFIGGIILLIVRRFTTDRWMQFLIAASFIWTYTLAVGAEPPAVRASLMFTLVLLGHALFRPVSLVNLLGLCVLLLLAWRPSDIFNPSFQLTLISVSAIVVMAVPLIGKLRSIGRWMPSAAEPFPPNVPIWLQRFCETLYWNGAIWQIENDRQIWSAGLFKRPFASSMSSVLIRTVAWIFDGLLVSLIVQIWMLPLLVYYFHRVPLASILLNLFVGIVVAAISVVGLITTVIAEVNAILAIPFVGFVEFLSLLMIKTSGLFVFSREARIPIDPELAPLYFLYLIPVLVLGSIAFGWNPFKLKGNSWLSTMPIAGFSSIALLLTLGCIIYFHPFSKPVADGKLRIDFLDVGQGDSALFMFPDGQTMLIDAGGRPDYGDEGDFDADKARIGEFVVSEFLWERGLSSVDHIVSSHADADHIQGLVDVAKNFRIGTAHFANVQGESSDYLELKKIIDDRGVAVEYLSAGDAFEIGGVRVEVLYPGLGEKSLSENDRSLVMLITFGEHTVLLTGDIESEAERRLLAARNVGSVEVVKAPHHGSRTSSTAEFVDKARPELVIIPVGRRSQFGHPHPDVVDRWGRTGAKILRTGHSGTITVISDGHVISFSEFRQQK